MTTQPDKSSNVLKPAALMSLNRHRVLAIAIACIGTLSITGHNVWADDDGDDHYSAFSWGKQSNSGVAPVKQGSPYQKECGGCHMPYPAGLLPPHSWEKIMTSLEDHFGENAEIEKDDWRTVTNYLLNNAAGRIDYRISNKMLKNIRGVPQRITELPYFIHEHREIPKRMVAGNTKVRSFSHCDACHSQAEKGNFNEHQVLIPGYGKFDDQQEKDNDQKS
jgi:hypothetical protein